jgi:hypothetical protein
MLGSGVGSNVGGTLGSAVGSAVRSGSGVVVGSGALYMQTPVAALHSMVGHPLGTQMPGSVLVSAFTASDIDGEIRTPAHSPRASVIPRATILLNDFIFTLLSHLL